MRNVPRLIAGILLAASAMQPAHGQTNPKGKFRTIEPAKDVTYFTEPLDANGNVDYFAALNIHLSKGITPENNAAALLWQVFGIERIPTRHVDTVAGPLEIKRSIPREQRFVTTLEFFRSKAPNAGPPPKAPPNVIYLTPPEAPEVEERRNRFNASCMNFWSDDDEPELKELLDRNKAALDLVVEAAARPACFSPIYPDDGEDRSSPLLINSSTQFDNLCADAERQLTCRALRSAALGHLPQALEDLLAGHRLARHLQSGPFFSNFMASSGLSARVRVAEQTLLSNSALNKSDARSYLWQLRKISSPPALAEILDVGERALLLQAMQSRLVNRTPVTFGDESIVMQDFTLQHDIPYEEPFRAFNRSYDRWVAVARLAGLDAQLARVAELQAEEARSQAEFFKRLQSKVRQGHLEDLAKLDRDDRLAMFVQEFSRLVSKDESIFCVAARSLVYRDLSQIAFSAAAFRAERERWPNGLSDLIPQFLPTYPVDPFSGKSYQLTLDRRGQYSEEPSRIVFSSVGDSGVDVKRDSKTPRRILTFEITFEE